MNAWYFTFEFPPDMGGGLSTYMRIVTEGYAARPESSLVVFTLSTTQSGLFSRSFLHPNVQIVRINPQRSLEPDVLGHWVNVARLFERFADLVLMQIETGELDLPRPDYMEFPDGFGIGALCVQQKLCRNARYADVPIVVTAHTPTYVIDRLNQMPDLELPRYWTGRMELSALAGADLVIGCSQAILDLLADELARTGARLPRAEVLHNPFADVREPGTESAWQDGPDMPPDHFYMASRLTHWKGAESAIRAMEVLWDEGCTVPFLIYGDDTRFAVTGTDYGDYIRKRFARHVERGLIRFMGKQPRDVIRRAARTAFAQVHPSHFDNFPYSVVEAMNEGAICVAGTNGGIREIAQDGRDLFLVDVMDHVAFAGALRRVMAMDEGARGAMARSAQATIGRHCDLSAYLDRKEALVADLHRSAPARRQFPFLAPPDEACHILPAQAAAGGPELSVVIPYFNMGQFIDATLASLRAATQPRLEIVLVNDGSTDPRSVARLDRLHEDHGLDAAQLRILTIPNGGVANARNTGVRASTAPFVTLLDADDLVAPRYYEKALQVLRSYDNVSFCGAWIEDFDRKGRIRNWATWNAEPPLQLVMNQTNCQSLVYKREAFERDGWHDPDLRMFLDDWEGVISLMAGGHRGVMIPEALFEYRIRGTSIFRSNGRLWNINYDKITRKHAALYDRWGSFLAGFLNVNGPNTQYHIAGKPSDWKN